MAKAESSTGSRRRSSRSTTTRNASGTAPSQRLTQAKRVGRLLGLFAAIILIVDGLVGDRGFMAMRRTRRQYEELSATLARQRVENAKLRDEAGRLRSDPGAIEELARRELGLIRPGEKVFIIKDLKPSATP